MAQAAREHREMAKAVRQEERAARAAQLAAARAEKARDRAAATSQKSRDRQNIAKRKASSTQNIKIPKRRRVVEAESGGGDASPPAAAVCGYSPNISRYVSNIRPYQYSTKKSRDNNVLVGVENFILWRAPILVGCCIRWTVARTDQLQ